MIVSDVRLDRRGNKELFTCAKQIDVDYEQFSVHRGLQKIESFFQRVHYN